MNFNANLGNRQPMGRKIKRVSDVNAMGIPAQPVYNTYNQPASVPNVAQEHPTQQPPVYGDYTSTTFQVGHGYQNSGTSVPLQQTPAQFSILTQPVVQDMALQYGQQLANTGKHIVKAEMERYVPVTKLKYYFAVDTRYVLSKLKLLLFPFGHSDWSIKYEQDEPNPVQPRLEVNAPDLYIPVMAYVTYVLVAGLVLGMQQKFSPEQIGIQASSALAWCIVEMAVYMATLYIANIRTTLRTLDLLAYSGYKYICIIVSVLCSLAFARTGYYCSLLYCSLALAFFLVRSLKAQVLPEGDHQGAHHYGDHASVGSKRRLYFLLFVALVQPILSYWLTYHLVNNQPKSTA